MVAKIPQDIPMIHGLKDRPDVLELVGPMVLGYSEIEFRMYLLFRAAAGGNTDASFVTFFSIRTEGKRIEAWATECQPYMNQKSLGQPFSDTLEAIRTCKRIRNQYAHCTWSANAPLRFMNLEENAKRPPTDPFIYHTTDVELLRQQYLYFVRTMLWAGHLVYLATGDDTSGTPSSQPPFPAQPQLYLT